MRNLPKNKAVLYGVGEDGGQVHTAAANARSTTYPHRRLAFAPMQRRERVGGAAALGRSEPATRCARERTAERVRIAIAMTIGNIELRAWTRARAVVQHGGVQQLSKTAGLGHLRRAVHYEDGTATAARTLFAVCSAPAKTRRQATSGSIAHSPGFARSDRACLRRCGRRRVPRWGGWRRWGWRRLRRRRRQLVPTAQR